MNKILVTIQGKTLILYYQIRQGLAHTDVGSPCYIQVLPSAELSRFNLKGLSPEMFCVNISDMVNIRGLYSAQVENEKQIPVAKWEMNYDEFLQLKNTATKQLTHRQIAGILAEMPGYTGETDNQYIEFEECVVAHPSSQRLTCSGYRLTLMTEEVENTVSTRAYYYLDTHTDEGWLDLPPPPADYAAIRTALAGKLQSIRDAGVNFPQASDETDYLIAPSADTGNQT